MKSIFGAVTGVLLVLFFVAGAMFDEFIHKIRASEANASATAQKRPAKDDFIEVSANIEASVKITPSVFVAHPSFYASEELKNKPELSASDKEAINATFARITELAAKSGICTGGAYQVYPVRSKDDATKQWLAASLECKITREKLNDYSNLTSEIEKALASDKFVRADLAAFEQSASEEDAAKAKTELESKIFAKIAENANALSEKLGKKCEARKIAYSQSAWHLARVGANLMSAKDGASLPIARDEKRAMNADVTYICK